MTRLVASVLCVLALALGCSSGEKSGFSAEGYADAAPGALPPEAGAPEAGPDATPDAASDAPADAAPPACTLEVPKDQPTLAAAFGVAADGDVICVADGTYSETVTVKSTDRSLTLRAVGDKVVWNGELLLTGAPGAGHTIVVEGFQFGCAPANVSASGSAGRIVVRDNRFDNACGYAMDLENSGAGSVTAVFERNKLVDTSLSASLGAPKAGAKSLVVLKNNLVTGGGGFALLADGAWARYVVTGNTLDIDAGYTLVQLELGADQGAGSSMSDNVLAGGSTAISCLSCGQLDVSNNLLFSGNATYGNVVLGSDNLQADPLFRGADDWRLEPWSPALYAGRRKSAAPADEDLADDIDSHQRPAIDIDMGAYQH